MAEAKKEPRRTEQGGRGSGTAGKGVAAKLFSGSDRKGGPEKKLKMYKPKFNIKQIMP